MFGVVEEDILMVFLFANLCSSWSGGKQESTSCRNLAPMLVDMDCEEGGLNHVTLFFLRD